MNIGNNNNFLRNNMMNSLTEKEKDKYKRLTQLFEQYKTHKFQPFDKVLVYFHDRGITDNFTIVPHTIWYYDEEENKYVLYDPTIRFTAKSIIPFEGNEEFIGFHGKDDIVHALNKENTKSEETKTSGATSISQRLKNTIEKSKDLMYSDAFTRGIDRRHAEMLLTDYLASVSNHNIEKKSQTPQTIYVVLADYLLMESQRMLKYYAKCEREGTKMQKKDIDSWFDKFRWNCHQIIGNGAIEEE